jgi:hypothetical protein
MFINTLIKKMESISKLLVSEIFVKILVLFEACFLNCTGDVVSCAQYVTRVHRCITGELVLRAKLTRVLNRKFNLGKWSKILEVELLFVVYLTMLFQ